MKHLSFMATSKETVQGSLMVAAMAIIASLFFLY